MQKSMYGSVFEQQRSETFPGFDLVIAPGFRPVFRKRAKSSLRLLMKWSDCRQQTVRDTIESHRNFTVVDQCETNRLLYLQFAFPFKNQVWTVIKLNKFIH